MKSTRFSGKNSSDPTKKSGRKTRFLICENAAFSGRRPAPGLPGDNPTHPGAKRAAFAATPRCAAPPPPAVYPSPRGPAGKARRRARPARPAGFGPVCPCARRAAPPPGNGPPARPRPPQARRARPNAPPRFSAAPPPNARPACAPAETAAAPRPVCPPEGRRPRRPGPCRPPRGVPRRPRGPTGPRRGVPRARAAAPPGVCPQGGIKSQGAVCRRPRPPSRVNFREIRDPGYSPPKQQTAAQKMDGCSLIPQCSGGCL